MTIVSNITLLDTLRQTRLLSAAQIETVQRLMPGRLVDARALARVMLQQGWLTVYQINQLLAGRGRELILGPYQVLDRLGQGGQSTVFKARHAEAELVVALKVVRAEVLANPEAARQFMHEMEAMATLDHPNVVQFHDADRVDDSYYCALEYVEGTDLGKYVRLSGPLPSAEACDYIRQTALGLQHAHERNLIHRDIKPVNLCLTGEPALGGSKRTGVGSLIKILDWGLASLRPPQAPSATEEALNCVKSLIGTADYLSPEQAINPDTVDIRGDIYSLGCTFYYLLTGQPPFPEGTVMQKIIRHQKEDPVAIDEIRPDLPLGLAAILRRMLAKRPEERYQTPAAVALAVKPFCRADRFLIPRLNREARYRLGLEPNPNASTQDTPLPGSLRNDGSSGSTFGPHSKSDALSPANDTLHRWEIRQ